MRITFYLQFFMYNLHKITADHSQYTAEGNNAVLIGQFSGPETESPRQGYYTASE